MTQDQLIASAEALLDLDARGALVPHGIGGHARTIIEGFLALVPASGGEAEPPAVALLRGPLSKRATSAEFNEWQAREVVAYIDAIAYFRSLHEDDMLSSLGALYLAAGYERIGDPGSAQSLRQEFAEAWDDADSAVEGWSRPGFVPPTLRGR